eukprot:jgi/Chlat1/5788/Chrsp387S05509
MFAVGARLRLRSAVRASPPTEYKLQVFPTRRRPSSAPARTPDSFATRAMQEDKVVHFLRHGVTEMNEYLANLPAEQRYGMVKFEDPMLYDTRLTPRGHQQAAAAALRVAGLSPSVELIVCSPLTRALRTMQLACSRNEAPTVRHVAHPRSYLTDAWCITKEADAKLQARCMWTVGTAPAHHVHVQVVLPLARERLYMSSDVGRSPSKLAAEFPELDFSGLPEMWWYVEGTIAGTRGEGVVVPETEENFLERMEELREWLGGRPERSLLVVAHWGVCEALTGDDYANCELNSYKYSELLLPQQRMAVR